MTDTSVREVIFEDVRDGLQNNSIVLLDVRGHSEIEKDGKIASSINIPVNELKEALRLSSEEFEMRYKTKKPSKVDKIVCHCHLGRRAVMATQLAGEQGYNAFAYTGSFQDWLAKGGPVNH